ncbi:MAG: hypothetical protein K2X77_31615 [Candidatus Obscuribacterales bacterium]|nr:hypothetical protein [Candidatus Obscuribacterales bacterium]
MKESTNFGCEKNARIRKPLPKLKVLNNQAQLSVLGGGSDVQDDLAKTKVCSIPSRFPCASI